MAEWAVLEPFLPPPSHVGRPRKWPMRLILEAILHLLRGGLHWPSHYRLDCDTELAATATRIRLPTRTWRI